MIAALWLYFGVVGIASILAWLGAVVLLAAGVRRGNRTKLCRMAMVMAVAGLLLAKINSHYVSAIEVDRAEEYAKATERQKELRRELDQQRETRAAKIRFAEDTPVDALDMAGVSTSQTAVVGVPTDPVDPAKFAYRQRGKQARTVAAGAAATGVVAPETGHSAGPSVKTRQVRQLPERDVIQANRLDRVNLFCARLGFWFALLLLVVDYLVRFNRTFGYLYPLPIANSLIDSVWPKRYTVAASGLALDARRKYLEDVLRKGETFVYFGEADLWPDLRSLPRWRFRQWRAGLRGKVVVGEGRVAVDDEFVFESAWFHRYAFVVVGIAEAARRLVVFTAYLEGRHATRARACRTVHLVWACAVPPDAAVLARLVSLCPETNFKLMVTGPVPAGVEFEEVAAGNKEER